MIRVTGHYAFTFCSSLLSDYRSFWHYSAAAEPFLLALQLSAKRQTLFSALRILSEHFNLSVLFT